MESESARKAGAGVGRGASALSFSLLFCQYGIEPGPLALWLSLASPPGEVTLRLLRVLDAHCSFIIVYIFKQLS